MLWKRNKSLRQCPTEPGKLGAHSPLFQCSNCSSFLPQEKSLAETNSHGTKLYFPGEGWYWQSQAIPHTHSNCIWSWICLLTAVLELLLWKQVSQCSLIHEGCPSHCPPGAPRPWPRGLELVHGSWATTGYTTGTEVYVPIIWCADGQYSSKFLQHRVPTAPPKAFLFMMDANFLLWSGRTKIRDILGYRDASVTPKYALNTFC